ncbi:AMP-binding protein [Nocardioides sp. LHD-245]|uniref:acyl-CoA synthetase n=1 Tax=Nocardioides sp. LHD-245 TaxID=3051387 RepID=UPI0027E16020|nr:AMP-binding protein [Nocardioides sp. LHD-245]
MSEAFLAELRAERELPTQDLWEAAVARLDWPLSRGLNTAHEAADRWGRDRARLAYILHHPDGSSERWTFAELAETSSRLATAWRKAGLRPGDRVAGVVGQQTEAYIAALAAWRAGFVYMPLFAGFGTTALADRLAGGDPKVVVVDHHHRDQVDAALAAGGIDPAVYTVAGPGGRGLRHGDRSFWAELESHDALTSPVETLPSDPATLIYTSGTTGAPKGCLQAHQLILTVQPYIRHVFGLQPEDLIFAGASPGWSYGLYTVGICPQALGHARVAYSGDFDPEAWLRIIDRERVTFIGAAPSAYRRLVATAERGAGIPRSVRGASSSGEPLDAPLASAWRRLTGHDLQDGYGQSELAMVLANLTGTDEPVEPGALAAAVPGFDVELVDADGVPQERSGIIAVRRPQYQASVGYQGRDDLWQDRWRGEYFLTGDLAEIDDAGRYRFVGREDDLIVTSGYNVGPSEVEAIILGRPGVADAAVVAAPDPKRGSAVRAVVVADGTVDRERLTAEIQEAVREGLGRHAWPRIVDFVDELPRTETGKIRRHALRARS